MHRHCFWVTRAGALPAIPIRFVLEMGRTPGARLSGPEGWGGEKAPCHYIRGEDATCFSRKWDMTNPRFTRICTDWRSLTTCHKYPVLHWYLKHAAGKLRGFHCVPKSWHILPAIHFANCCPETTALSLGHYKAILTWFNRTKIKPEVNKSNEHPKFNLVCWCVCVNEYLWGCSAENGLWVVWWGLFSSKKLSWWFDSEETKTLLTTEGTVLQRCLISVAFQEGWEETEAKT